MAMVRWKNCSKKMLCWSNNFKITASFHRWKIIIVVVVIMIKIIITFIITTFSRVKTSSFRCEKVETIFFQNKNRPAETIESHQVKTIFFQPEWRFVKHTTSVIDEHHGPIEKTESIWRTTGRNLPNLFCETFARHRASTAVVYVKPYDDMLQVFKQHKNVASSTNSRLSKKRYARQMF